MNETANNEAGSDDTVVDQPKIQPPPKGDTCEKSVEKGCTSEHTAESFMDTEEGTNTGIAPGGSTASDFQPPTRNPQSDVGGGLQPTTPALQNSSVLGVSQEQLNQQPPTPIRVETQTTSTIVAPRPEITQSPVKGNNIWLGFVMFFGLIVVAAIIFKRWNLFVPESVIVAPAAAPETVKKSAAPTPKKKKTAARSKKKTSAKKK